MTLTERELRAMYRSLQFVEELIDYIAEYPDDDYMTMECLCRKLFKHGLIDKKDGYYLVADGITADRKTEPNNSKVSENPTDSTRSKMEQVDKDIYVRSKDEPQTGEMMTEEEFDSMLARVLTGKTEPQTERSE